MYVESRDDSGTGSVSTRRRRDTCVRAGGNDGAAAGSSAGGSAASAGGSWRAGGREPSSSGAAMRTSAISSGRPTNSKAVCAEPGHTGLGGDDAQSPSIRTRSAQERQIVSVNAIPGPRQEMTRRGRG